MLRFNIPAAKPQGLLLFGGFAVFGIGWSLSGFCPGGLIWLAISGEPSHSSFSPG
ncbi:MAG TPA: hypothetical protein VKA94_14890 [Hyphomicrobiales bacterium]|nr:hypothetical protein [Hyphomicrobiales bacterium]